MEEWRDIPGYEGLYQVSNQGRVKSLMHKKVLSPFENNRGYLSVSLLRGGKRLVHRLVAEVFIPNHKSKPNVNHKDGNPKNNTASNLEWCTQSENIIHAYKTGLNSKQKAVMMIKDGKCLKEFYSVHEAERSIGKRNANVNICSCCNGKRKSAYGFQWRYKD